MKYVFALTLALCSFSSYATTDKEMCEQYGRALAGNAVENQKVFLNELTSRTQQGTWSLSVEECAMYIKHGKNDFNFELVEIVLD
ncbi:hypothetical protein ACQKPX_12895 [Photobacterium sp. DNB23_23_1]|uniref:Uncharacterized protein n=1 Tax=Photobacterium pectinilyticum TaxID=2906793 RepID=A0ABT1N6J8_9GAMM|nr:hypothetical protein [Photobacterium sp. ZSDE20]MCQ1060379.1 hypothetical protein [Photobacterium sp. ZSDE20]MDD1826911.1 hypothetical protein [Photobacterium sp. ZSDE20]